ncbi:hypothetical protein ABE096_06355 [Robertmurraya massiliosenegalensis]|uniref:hypothetical protein n=1 Tax=Robertmurraya TaxID=2837507 RepID=UPI0039A5AF9D
MSFWTWVAIAIALIGGLVAANSRKKKSDKRNIHALIWFIIAVVLFLVWWFTR